MSFILSNPQEKSSVKLDPKYINGMEYLTGLSDAVNDIEYNSLKEDVYIEIPMPAATQIVLETVISIAKEDYEQGVKYTDKNDPSSILVNDKIKILSGMDQMRLANVSLFLGYMSLLSRVGKEIGKNISDKNEDEMREYFNISRDSPQIILHTYN